MNGKMKNVDKRCVIKKKIGINYVNMVMMVEIGNRKIEWFKLGYFHSCIYQRVSAS